MLLAEDQRPAGLLGLLACSETSFYKRVGALHAIQMRGKLSGEVLTCSPLADCSRTSPCMVYQPWILRHPPHQEPRVKSHCYTSPKRCTSTLFHSQITCVCLRLGLTGARTEASSLHKGMNCNSLALSGTPGGRCARSDGVPAHCGCAAPPAPPILLMQPVAFSSCL